MATFDILKRQMSEHIQNTDTEAAHSNADHLLCEIALHAANGDLTHPETKILIELYHLVNKWYA